MKLFLLILSAVVAAEAVFNGYGIPYTPDLTNPDPDFPFRIGRVSKRQFGFLERLFAWFKKPTQDSSDNSSGSPYDIPNHYVDVALPFPFNPAGKRQMQLDPWTEALLARLRKAKQDSPDASNDKAKQDLPDADLDHYVDVALPFPFNPAGKRQMQLDPWTEALLARLRKAKQNSPDASNDKANQDFPNADLDHHVDVALPFSFNPVGKRQMQLDPWTEALLARLRKAKQDSPDASNDKAKQDLPDADLSHYVDVGLPFPFNPTGKRQMQLDPWTEALLARLRKAKQDSPDAVIDVDHMVSKRRLVLPPIFPGYLDPTQKIAKQDSPDATINPVLPPTFPAYLDALKKGEQFVIPDNVVNLMDRFGIVSKRHAE